MLPSIWNSAEDKDDTRYRATECMYEVINSPKMWTNKTQRRERQGGAMFMDPVRRHTAAFGLSSDLNAERKPHLLAVEM